MHTIAAHPKLATINKFQLQERKRNKKRKITWFSSWRARCFAASPSALPVVPLQYRRHLSNSHNSWNLEAPDKKTYIHKQTQLVN